MSRKISWMIPEVRDTDLGHVREKQVAWEQNAFDLSSRVKVFFSLQNPVMTTRGRSEMKIIAVIVHDDHNFRRTSLLMVSPSPR